MNTVLLHAADLLTRALNQVEQAHRHLNRARRYAAVHGQETVERGTSDLIENLSRLTLDLRTLVGGLRCRAQYGETSR